MSANVLSDNRLLEALELSLHKKLFDPQRMIIEITENVVATHMETAMSFIHQCKKYGIKFALDDFGVGLSSFSQLKRLPVDYLKIDGSFIQQICHSDIDKQFVKSMVNIARCLNIVTVAEYVEDKQTEEILNALGVGYTQGFYYSKPGEVSKVIERGKNML